MDAAVARALARWPNVPACYGWLRLSARGLWLVGAEAQPVRHAGLIAFIGRNYGADERGAWFFQNGPQRVFATLEAGPYVWLLAHTHDDALQAHTGAHAGTPDAVWLDDHGALWLRTALGVGTLCDRDLARAALWLHDRAGAPADAARVERFIASAGTDGALRWRCGTSDLELGFVARRAAAQRFGFQPCPVAPT